MLYDVVWVSAKHLPKADTYLKTIPDEAKLKRGINGWRYFPNCPTPLPDGTFQRGLNGSCVMVDFPGITIIDPRSLIKGTPPRFTATEYLDIVEVEPGVIGGALKDGFWERPEVQKLKLECLDREQRLRPTLDRALKDQPQEDPNAQETAHAVRQYFETIAYRVNPASATNPALLPDKALANIALMVKLTGEIQLPDLEEWIDQLVERKEPEVRVWRPNANFTEFLDEARVALGNFVRSKTVVKDADGRLRAG